MFVDFTLHMFVVEENGGERKKWSRHHMYLHVFA